MLILCVYVAQQITIKGTGTAHILSVRSLLQNMAEEDLAHHVVGNDSGMCKAGFPGDDAARACSVSVGHDNGTCNAGFLDSMGPGASPFFVGGVICLISSVSLCTEKKRKKKDRR